MVCANQAMAKRRQAATSQALDIANSTTNPTIIAASVTITDPTAITELVPEAAQRSEVAILKQQNQQLEERLAKQEAMMMQMMQMMSNPPASNIAPTSAITLKAPSKDMARY